MALRQNVQAQQMRQMPGISLIVVALDLVSARLWKNGTIINGAVILAAAGCRVSVVFAIDLVLMALGATHPGARCNRDLLIFMVAQ